MTIDKRLEALTMNVEPLLQESQLHSKQLAQDAEHIRALVRVAELHHERSMCEEQNQDPR